MKEKFENLKPEELTKVNGGFYGVIAAQIILGTIDAYYSIKNGVKIIKNIF